MKTFPLDFTAKQWEEICSLGCEGFEPVPGKELTRLEWMCIGHMALGKAMRIENKDYGGSDDEDSPVWAAELREIAKIVFSNFRPGDGKI
jgi:hypothetical protein